MEHLSLLADGRAHDPAEERARWEKAAADVLRKAGRMAADDPDALVWDKLTRTTLDGVAVAPLGTPSSLDGLPPVGLPGQAPYTRGAAVTRPQEGWDVRAHLGDPDAKQAHADALLDLENGVTSLWLTIGQGGIAVADLPAVLDGVLLDIAPVAVDSPDDPVGAAEAFCALLDERGVTAAPGTSLGVDPWSARYLSGAAPRVDALPRLVELARERAHVLHREAAEHRHEGGARRPPGQPQDEQHGHRSHGDQRRPAAAADSLDQPLGRDRQVHGRQVRGAGCGVERAWSSAGGATTAC
jgi:methylmalonyl-CoA mutase